MTDTPRKFAASVVRVIDGDTIELDIDLGFHVTVRHVARVFGVNCPELHGDTKEAGEAAKAFTQAWCAANPSVSAWTSKPRPEDKYGRYLVDLIGPTDDLTTALLKSGHAVPYDGGKR